MNIVKYWSRKTLNEMRTGAVAGKISRSSKSDRDITKRGNITEILKDAKRRAEAAGERCSSIEDKSNRLNCKLRAYNSAIQYLRTSRSRCTENRDPENCQQRIDSEIQKLEQKVEEVQGQLRAERFTS